MLFMEKTAQNQMFYQLFTLTGQKLFCFPVPSGKSLSDSLKKKKETKMYLFLLCIKTVRFVLEHEITVHSSHGLPWAGLHGGARERETFQKVNLSKFFLSVVRNMKAEALHSTTQFRKECRTETRVTIKYKKQFLI